MLVINPNAEPRRELVLIAGSTDAEAALVHREALRVLRPDIATAHVDAYSDDAWPRAVLHSYERALSLARGQVADGTRSRKDDPGMGIDVDVRDDRQFEMLSDLVPHTINAEGWQGDRQIFSASDSGTSLWFAVTGTQEAELVSRLEALGVRPTVLAAPPRRRGGAFLTWARRTGASTRRP